MLPPGDLVGSDHAARDHDDRQRGCLHALGEAGDDVRRMPGRGRFGDLLDRAPAAPGVVLGDRDEQEGDREADERRAVELPERELRPLERLRDGDEPDRGEHRRGEDAHVERVDDRVLALADAREERADDRGQDRHAAERERVQPEAAVLVGGAEQHHRDGGDGVRLEQVGGHAGAVADVVADVVGDHGRVARVVLGDAGLDLADEVGADVGGLREDAAAEPGEDGDERAAEGEAEEVVDGRLGRVVERSGQEPVVPGDAEETETDDEEPRHGAGPERDLECRGDALASRLGGARVRADGDVHPDEPGRCGEHGADQEPECRAPAELGVEPDHQDRDDRDVPDRRVLLFQVGGGAFLHSTRDLPHALVARRLAEQPVGQVEPVQHGSRGTDECERNCMVTEEIHQPSGGTSQNDTSQRKRRNGSARPIM